MIYDTLKLVHVLAVILWFGGGVMLTLVAGRASRTSLAALAPVARIGAGLGSFFGAVSGVAFLTGVGMVLATDGPAWEWESTFIVIGVVVFLASSVLGSRFIGPRYAVLADAAESHDEHATAAARSAVVVVTMIDLTLLTIAVASMVYKWGA